MGDKNNKKDQRTNCEASQNY